MKHTRNPRSIKSFFAKHATGTTYPARTWDDITEDEAREHAEVERWFDRRVDERAALAGAEDLMERGLLF